MERIQVTTKEEMEIAVEKASEVLGRGGVIIFPTDTLYGLGVDATSDTAIEKIFKIKGRDEDKPLSVMVSDLEMAEEYVEQTDLSERLIRKVLPGPFTFVLPKKDTLPDSLTSGKDTLGIRIPDSYFCIAVTKKFGKPITATSANKSGKENARTIDEILLQLGERADLIDLVIDVGDLEKRDPSTVLKVTPQGVEVLREGNINHTALLNVTRPEVT